MMSGIQMSDGHGQETSSQLPVARLEYICSRDGRKTKGIIAIYDNDIFKIGRDPRSNDFSIQSDRESLVSRNHCEFYTVVYEPGLNYVYVRDRKSFNGTLVNDKMIGKGPGFSSGYLLEDGDVIKILPYWKFIFHQESSPPLGEMSIVQLAESQLFADKYTISKRCIGKGVDANVFLAQDVKAKKQIVCKVVNLDEYQSRSSRDNCRRKLQEADILRQLRHPNILSYVDSISSPHSLFIFTELAAGGDLMSFINRHNGVKEFDCRIIIRQVVRGLGYLHKKSIIHRDLKPENILIAHSPKLACHRIMLSDFATCAVPRRSRLKTTVGTANYQAPEVHIPYLSQTPAMDMWSLGVVTTVMLSAGLDIEDAITGISRCDQDTLLERLQQHIFPPSLKLSQNGKAFVWQCLQVSPQDRMTVFEAQWHDWMRTPESHLQFFERLDQNILGDWQARAEASPMPLQLPSVLMSSLNETQDQDKLLKSYARLSHRYPLLQTEFSNYFRPSMPEYESQTGVCDGQLHSIAEHEEAGESWHETPSSAAASESSATELDNEDIATIRGFTRSEPSYTKQNKAHRAFDPLVEGEINAQKNENMFPYSTEI